jgi:hypothetical protein
MAKSFVSPGVFTNEIDASFLAPGIGTIGAAFLGLAQQGPAFVPVTVTSYSDYVSVFGDLNDDYVLPYAAKAYLKNSSVLNVVRILGPDSRTVNGSAVNAGYTAESLWAISAFTGSAATTPLTPSGSVMALLEITGSHSLRISNLVGDKIDLRITGSTGTASSAYHLNVTASFLSGSPNYIGKVLNTDPTLFSTYGYYVREIYDYNVRKFGDSTIGLGSASYSSASFSNMNSFAFGYNSGSTPWIKSQAFGGASEYNLFRFHTLGHGEVENGRLKVSIRNIRPSAAPSVSAFGKFDVEVRSFVDTDASPAVLERFPNVSLDPNDPGYILKSIGDKLLKYDFSRDKMVETGNYGNKSKLIRLEFTTGSFPDSSLPWGFRGLAKPNLTVSASTHGIVFDGLGNLPYVANLLAKKSDGTHDAEVSTKVYWGLETQLSGNVKGRLDIFSNMTGSDADFSLKHISGSSETADTTALGLSYRKDQFDAGLVSVFKDPGNTTTVSSLSPNVAKFTVPFAFAYNGFDRRIAAPLSNEAQLASVTQLGTQAVRQAIDVIKDPDFIDINLLVIPGIYSIRATDYAISKVEERADAFYVMDISGSSDTDVVQNIKNRSLDTSYAGCYYPDVNIFDTVNNKVVRLPAAAAAAAAIAYNDRVAYAWFAPAGLNRAGLNESVIGFKVTNLIDQLKQSERDNLYENRVNPIARFPDVPEGVIWGQKTLQLKSSALDRINVRRLMIKAKKLIASAVKFLVFEPNNAATQTRFRQLVNPILADIQQKQGLEVFKVVMDSTTNTPDLIDRNVMAGKIFLVPTKSAEYISIDFVISPSGATFGD